MTTTSVPTSTDAPLENRKLSAATSSTHYSASFVSSRQGPPHALRLQKVYKSFRTRRQLADCAVLVEQSWCVRSLIS